MLADRDAAHQGGAQEPDRQYRRLTAMVRTLARRLAATVGLLALGAILAFGALMLGGDRVIPCSSRSGPDAWLGDEVNHIDGPEGGGGCIVPTSSAWVTALIAGLLPLAAGTVRLTWPREPGERAQRT
jgi:hypothetical protein